MRRPTEDGRWQQIWPENKEEELEREQNKHPKAAGNEGKPTKAMKTQRKKKKRKRKKQGEEQRRGKKRERRSMETSSVTLPSEPGCPFRGKIFLINTKIKFNKN
jgi:hypothetical protein